MTSLQNTLMTDAGAKVEIQKRAKTGAVLTVLFTFVLVAALFWWGRTYTLEIWASGPAQVIPSSQIQVVQNLEGGIVSEVLVKAGDHVRQDQVVARIETSEAESSFQEDKFTWIALASRVHRLEAETSETQLVFGKDIDDGSIYSTAAIKSEMDNYTARRTELLASISILEASLGKFRQRAIDAREQLKHQMEVASLISEQIEIYGQLSLKKLVSKNELLQARRSRAEADANSADISANVNAAERDANETAARIEEIRSKFMSSALAELAEKRVALATVETRMRASQDRVKRQEIRAPVEGIVKRVAVTTPGEIVKPGNTIIEFVPSKDDLLLETKISPQNIGFIRAGQVTHVRMSAYDSSVYGSLTGRVERLGADTQLTSEGAAFYPVIVRIDSESLKLKKKFDIIPGMTADVSIVTGERSILDYVFKPVYKLTETAFRER